MKELKTKSSTNYDVRLAESIFQTSFRTKTILLPVSYEYTEDFCLEPQVFTKGRTLWDFVIANVMSE